MKRAYPIDSNGNKNGRMKSFTDEKWEKMVRTYGKGLRWVVKERKKYERK